MYNEIIKNKTQTQRNKAMTFKPVNDNTYINEKVYLKCALSDANSGKGNRKEKKHREIERMKKKNTKCFCVY